MCMHVCLHNYVSVCVCAFLHMTVLCIYMVYILLWLCIELSTSSKVLPHQKCTDQNVVAGFLHIHGTTNGN